MIYVIDHKDSFTQNIVHQFSLFDKVECDDLSQINKSKMNKASTIVFSPGPGSPKDYPESSKIYNRFKGKKKIIGICLGFQQILYCEGANIVEQKKIYHGFQSEIITNKFSNLFDLFNIVLNIKTHSSFAKLFSFNILETCFLFLAK